MSTVKVPDPDVDDAGLHVSAVVAGNVHGSGDLAEGSAVEGSILHLTSIGPREAFGTVSGRVSNPVDKEGPWPRYWRCCPASRGA